MGAQSKTKAVTMEKLPYTPPEVHHHVSVGERNWIDIGRLLEAHDDDPAMKVSPTAALGAHFNFSAGFHQETEKPPSGTIPRRAVERVRERVLRRRPQVHCH